MVWGSMLGFKEVKEWNMMEHVQFSQLPHTMGS